MPEFIKIILFLLWCNFLPPLANLVFGDRFCLPIDAGKKWFDKRPLFGAHKTFRGFLAALIGGTLSFPLFGFAWPVAAVAALLAMAGDLFTSFIKRRFNFASGTSAPVLDQLFESLFPALFFHARHLISWEQLFLVLLIFVPITYLGSRIWHFLLFRPPIENYPRKVRSTVRLKEWRACHQPLARWQKWLNFEDFIYYRLFMARFFKFTGLYGQGMQNALDVQVKEVEFYFADLPEKFDSFRVLFLVDLHLDGQHDLTDVIIDKIKEIEVDLCIVGGDIRMEVYGAIAPSVRLLRRLLKKVRSRHGIIGVLGNHDCLEMVPDLEDAGMMMLINDSCDIEVDGEKIWLVGVDDPHFYKVHDVKQAFSDLPEGGFVIFIAHSPEAYKDVGPFNPDLYLCGHTHGGQICFPGRVPLFTHSRAPRQTSCGEWHYKKMIGYTSCGVGSSGIPLRFHCPPEITVITLHKKE